jgi:RNA polymerase sigma factor (sigma-70 family)
LLQRFVASRDESAFAMIVRRHGPMVLGVCRRVLRHAHDSEDACQATFVVLARKAPAIRKHESLACWLHGVAFRVAQRLRHEVARRPIATISSAAPVVEADSSEAWREIRNLLDEEIRRLPTRLQAPVLLCYVEGMTRDEAAQQLGWSLGVLRGRLERARELLRGRLVRRGITLSAALLPTLLVEAAGAALPAALVTKLTAGVFSARIVSLAEGVLHAMFLSKLKIWTGMVVLGLLGLGAGAAALGPLLAQDDAAPAAAAQAGRARPQAGAADKEDDEAPALDPQVARNMAQSRVNLKQIILALHNHHDTLRYFPAPAIYAGGGRLPPGVPGGPGGMTPPGMGGDAAGPGGGSGPPPGPMGGATGGGIPGAAPPMGGPPGAGLPGVGVRQAKTPVAPKLKPLLSWRVAILPYLGEDELYREFNLEEAWDSPHNKKLLKRMPKVYAAPGAKAKEPTTTFYQAFVGPHAGFEKERHLAIRDFYDGTANTFLVVEAARAVPWSKPEDIDFDSNGPPPELGGLFQGIFNAGLAEGTVYAFSPRMDDETLRRAIMRDDGKGINLRSHQVPLNDRAMELNRANWRVKQEIQRERDRLKDLQREKQVLKELAEDSETDRLRLENETLEKTLRDVRDEGRRLREEIERLRKATDKR